jgi:PAS domain S-box-containing protein
MNKNINALFQTAAKFFYHKLREEGFSLDDLAEKTGITSTYLSAVINGSRIGSLDLQNRIAEMFYGPYDKFIGVGRRIAEGKEPLEDEPGGQNNGVEKVLAQLTHLVMDHKRIAEELKAADLKFKDISITSGDIIFELDKDFRVTFVSGKIMEIVGVSEKELRGKNIFKFYSDDEWKRLVPLIDDAIRNKSIIDTHIMVNKNGKTYYRHCIAKPVFEGRNKDFSGFRGTYRDITSNKRMEQNLLDEISLFQATIDSNVESAILITDKHNKVVRCNKAYQKMMGFPREIVEKEKISHNFSFLKQQLKNPEGFRKEIIEVFSSREKTVHYFEMKNGKTIKRKAIPVYRDGIFAGRITFFSDVTEKIEKRNRAIVS